MRLLSLSILLALGVPASGQPAADPYPYEVHLPAGLDDDDERALPLILFLHGGGGLIPADNPIPEFAASRADFPFVVVTPITDRPWEVERLDAVLREVAATHRIDEGTVYVTGLSMGAVGAWELAAAFPTRFRALALVAGRPSPEHACRLRELPVWLFHNRADEVVPAGGSEALHEALTACNAREAQLTIYEDLPAGVWHHNAWKAAYADPSLYEWFLSRE